MEELAIFRAFEREVEAESCVDHAVVEDDAGHAEEPDGPPDVLGAGQRAVGPLGRHALGAFAAIGGEIDTGGDDGGEVVGGGEAEGEVDVGEQGVVGIEEDAVGRTDAVQGGVAGGGGAGVGLADEGDAVGVLLEVRPTVRGATLAPSPTVAL